MGVIAAVGKAIKGGSKVKKRPMATRTKPKPGRPAQPGMKARAKMKDDVRQGKKIEGSKANATQARKEVKAERKLTPPKVVRDKEFKRNKPKSNKAANIAKSAAGAAIAGGTVAIAAKKKKKK